jgi:acetyl-CoA acetyltransferase
MVAGGMESMTNAPHLMFARKGIKYGAAQLFDHMAMDGLEDAYERGKAMGVFAEQCVDKYGFTREAQDQFAIASTTRAKAANEDGSFDWEMAPGHAARQGRRHGGQVRRAALQGQARQDPGPEARVQEGRHHHRRQRQSASATAPRRWC